MQPEQSVIVTPTTELFDVQTQEQLRIVIVGHVDHGKSTLVGRLLHDTHSLPEGRYQQIQEACRRRGVKFEWAFLMDAFQSERDQNITIDTAQTWFRTDKRQYVIIDAPGHHEFLKNMVTGAAGAEAAFLVIAADEGVQEQSRQHGYLLSLLGIDQVAVLVNKMDLVEYQQEAFARIEKEYGSFLNQLRVQVRFFIPIAARHGANIAARSPYMPWYEGLTAVEALDQCEDTRDVELPLRFPIQDIYRFDDRRILAGRVESGNLRVGDKLTFWPRNKTSVVRSIERWSAPRKESAQAGESVGITLSEQIFVERGHVASHPENPPVVTDRFRARLFWLGRAPLTGGARYKLKLATQEIECEIEAIEKVINTTTLEVATTKRGEIHRGEVAELTVHTKYPISLDNYSRIAATGRFVLVDATELSGGGIIHDAIYSVPSDLTVKSLTNVTREQRHFRNGHKGGVIWLTAHSQPEVLVLARQLERALFNRGMAAMVLDEKTALASLNSDLGFSAGDRAEGMRRLGEIARMFAQAGFIALTPAASPYRADRQRARRIALRDGCEFIEVFVRIPVPSAQCSVGSSQFSVPSGQLAVPSFQLSVSSSDFAVVGSTDYEPPRSPDLTVDHEKSSVEASITQIIDALIERLQLPPADYAI
ncbi:MAG TPA: GTP-binding protein [Acidobacteriota bacterium]|nr:GTP-binding protein [Acidobacteriota bacterium]